MNDLEKDVKALRAEWIKKGRILNELEDQVRIEKNSKLIGKKFWSVSGSAFPPNTPNVSDMHGIPDQYSFAYHVTGIDKRGFFKGIVVGRFFNTVGFFSKTQVNVDVSNGFKEITDSEWDEWIQMCVEGFEKFKTEKNETEG